MPHYGDKSGDSGVASYEVGPDFIIVRFKEGHGYLYNDAAPGRRRVESMKRLAARGQGLSTYISKHVRDNYAAKLE